MTVLTFRDVSKFLSVNTATGFLFKWHFVVNQTDINILILTHFNFDIRNIKLGEDANKCEMLFIVIHLLSICNEQKQNNFVGSVFNSKVVKVTYQCGSCFGFNTPLS